MGWNAGTSADDDTKPSGAGQETMQASAGAAKKTGSKKSIILILAGLAVTGLVAGWDWVRKLPKD